MKKKISLSFGIAGFLAIVLTAVLVSINYYYSFRDQVKKQLESYTYILQENDNLVSKHQFQKKNLKDDIRITLINQKGDVLYESEANLKNMNNHLERPEIRDAIQKGSGSAIRQSETSGTETMYYAKLLDNGEILRASKELKSIWEIFLASLPSVLILSVIIVLIFAVISWILTNQIVNPIDEMAENIDEIDKYVAYDELKPFAKKIRSQNIMRSEFTANVSHELKTPLTSISGYAQLIESGIAQEKDIRNFAGKIDKESNRLLELINDIMKLSKLDEGSEDEVLVETDLLAIAKQCAKRLELKAEKREIAFKVVGEKNVIKAVPSMLEEMVYNLCDNSIRYNRQGGIVIVSVFSLNNHVVLSVKDNGIGIPKEHIDHIFERFYRVDKSHSKETGGTGLGLSIVKHIVMYYKGKIEIQSQEGKGTEIKIIF